MSGAPGEFRAFVAERDGDGVRREVRTLRRDDLPDGDVTVRVAWSGVNYKDGLATIPRGQVARISPLVPGIDLAGEVIESGVEGLPAGDRVVVHGYDLGVAHHGGYAEVARVPAEWVVPLPGGLDERAAMAVGTAGYTAAASVVALERHGVEPGGGPVLVLGATGGVGSVAVSMLAARGHEVVAVTGKDDAHDWLRGLGASEVLGRGDVTDEADRPLGRQRWAGVVDPVGGEMTAAVLPNVRYRGAVALSGLTAGARLPATVFPFILRNVALLGIDSVQAPIEERRELWRRLGDDLRPPGLDDIVAGEVTLDELEPALDRILAGGMRGRTLVRVG